MSSKSPNAKRHPEGYKAPQHWAIEQWILVHWSDGAPSESSGMNWSGVCDLTLIIQLVYEYDLTNALVVVVSIKFTKHCSKIK